MKIKFYKVLILTLILSISSCAVTKKLDKKQTDTSAKEEVLTQNKRKGDTATLIVPKIKFRDTTIYTVNRVGTRIETRYDDSGEIDRIDCYTSAIDELTKINRELITSMSEKKKDEEFKMDPMFLVIAGLVIVILFIIVIAYMHVQLGGIKKLIS